MEGSVRRGEKMTASRKKNVFLNVVFGYAAQVGIILLSFIGRKIFLNYLSVDYLGINGLYSNILTILSLPELGLDSAVVFFLYKPVADGNEAMIGSYVRYFKRVYFILAACIFCIGICMVPFLPFIVKSELNTLDLRIYYILFLLNTCLSYLNAHRVALLSAYQEQRVQKMATLGANILMQLIYIVVLICFRSYYLYVCATIAGTLINNVILSILCGRLHPIRASKSCEIDKKQIYGKIKSTFIYKIGTVLINSTDNILISMLVSTAAVGLYSNYYTVTAGVSAFISIINTALISSVGNLGAKRENAKQFDYFKLLTEFYHFVAAVGAIGFYLLLNNFIKLWLGSQYIFDDKIVFAIALNFYVSTAVSPVWMYREANGLFEKVKYLMLIMAGLNIVLSILLGIIWGTFGILFATVISRLLTCVWYEPKILFKNVFGERVGVYWRKQLKNFAATAVAMFASYAATANMPDSAAFFCLKAVLVAVITGVIFGIANIDRVRSIFQRRENKCSRIKHF